MTNHALTTSDRPRESQMFARYHDSVDIVLSCYTVTNSWIRAPLQERVNYVLRVGIVAASAQAHQNRAYQYTEHEGPQLLYE